jgi:G3E family GTPase
VVALVDAKHLPERLKDSPEAEEQIAFADVVLLNKTDLVSAQELAEVEALIRQINPVATIHRTERAAIALDKILDRGAFDLNRILENDPHFLDAEDHHHDHGHDHECGPDCDHDHHHHDHGHDHHHHGLAGAGHDLTVETVSLTSGELNPDVFMRWIQEVTQTDGPDILRLKGILAFKGDPDRFVVQGIHMIIEGDHQRPWREDEERRSRLVFIGRKLDREKLENGFKSCLA